MAKFEVTLMKHLHTEIVLKKILEISIKKDFVKNFPSFKIILQILENFVENCKTKL